jgi:hypothetical protein
LAPSGPNPTSPPDERGTSLVGTTFGFAAFLGFLLFAVNIAVGLYARSTATAIGFDQARLLAQQGAGCPAGTEDARAAIGQRLGGWWRHVDVAASSSRSLLPPALLRPTRLAELHRTFTVRIEVPR